MTDTSWAPDLTQFPGPKYLALSRALREAIRAGELPPNSQLPTVRDLAWRLHLTPGTVARAYQLATQEGLLAATVGRGTFVAAQSPRLGPTQPLYTERITGGATGLVDLRPPQVPEVGQAEAFRRALLDMAGTTGQGWLDYTS
ncbi:MAG: GntR family transcriptional regulator, partial [Tabrizicola sp.]